MWRSPLRTWLAPFLGALSLAVLYAPLVPPLFLARGGAGEKSPYTAILDNPDLVDAGWNSVVLAVLVSLITAPLAVLGALAVRETRFRRVFVLVMLVPLFVPGVSTGLAAALFFRMLGIDPSMFTMLVVQIIWALPFSFLIVLATMSTFDPAYLDAAYAHGANRVRAFFDIELPLIRPGVVGAATFAAVLSLNETIRTSLVQGAFNTLQTYIWAAYQNVGISPPLYALMSLLIMGTFLLLFGFVAVSVGRGLLGAASTRRRRATPDESTTTTTAVTA